MVLIAGAAVLSAATTSAVPGPTNAGTSTIPIPRTPFTGFGGYSWYGTTISISAQWVVPAILNNEQGVSASTWIGAQSSSNDAFLQIGITEQRFTPGPAAYEAFWSDTALRFEAQSIRAVGTNDTISASMTQTPTDWILRIDDLTENWSQTIRTHFAEHTHFVQGQWLQEDPPPSLNSAQDLPYPVTTIVRFSDVKIDSRIPTLPYDNAQALSGFGGVFLVPTVFSDDAFALPSAQGAAKQYLSDAARFDSDLYRIDIGLAASHEPLSLGQRRRAAGQVVLAFSGFNAVILRQSWPASGEADIQQLVRSDELVVDDYRAAAKASFKDSASLGRKVLLDYERFHMNVDTTRAQLGLPPT